MLSNEADMNAKIVQLQEQISKTETLCLKLKLYLEWVSELQRSDVPGAICVCEEALTLARQAGEETACEEEYARCLFHLGMLNARNGNYLEAISIVYDAIPRIEKLNDTFLRARAINVIAASNSYLGNYYEALNQFMKALEIFKQIDDPAWEAAVMNNIGYQYWHLENYEWALKYLIMSLSQAEMLGEKSLEGDVCETLCNVYHSKGEFEQALKYGLRGIALYQQSGDGHGEAEVLNSIGDSYMSLGQTAKALDCFKKALLLSRETGHRHEEVETLLRMGEHYSSMGEMDESVKVLKHALDEAEKLEAKRIIYECHRAMAAALKKSGDFQNALKHAEKYFQLYKQVFDERESLKIQSFEVMRQVETAQKDAEIYRLKNVALQNEIDERKKAQEALRKLAMTDPLTGLFNRRYFFELAEETYQQAKAVNPLLSVLLIDVDNFKLVNDCYGHIVGDEVLVQLAKIIKESVRKVDVVARYGGEEFIILLTETIREQALEIAERLRSTVETSLIQILGCKVRLAVSVGVAFFDIQGDGSFETLLNRADMSMYEAKQAGGNRVHIWGAGFL